MTATVIPVRPLSRRRRLALAVEVVITYVVARRELRRQALPEAVATLRRTARTTDSELPPRRLGQAVERTLRLVPLDTRCLLSSLVVTRVLARRGIPSVFVLAVSAGPDFGAHAWVECDGRPVLAAGAPDVFTRLLEL